MALRRHLNDAFEDETRGTGHLPANNAYARRACAGKRDGHGASLEPQFIRAGFGVAWDVLMLVWPDLSEQPSHGDLGICRSSAAAAITRKLHVGWASDACALRGGNAVAFAKVFERCWSANRSATARARAGATRENNETDDQKDRSKAEEDHLNQELGMSGRTSRSTIVRWRDASVLA